MTGSFSQDAVDPDAKLLQQIHGHKGLHGTGKPATMDTVRTTAGQIQLAQSQRNTHFLQFLAAIVVLFPYVLLTGGVTLGKLNAVGWVNLLIVGLVHTGVTYCMYFTALKELPGQKAAILSYIDPLVAVLISVMILGEAMTLTQGIGGALILGFTLLNELPSKTKRQPE